MNKKKAIILVGILFSLLFIVVLISLYYMTLKANILKDLTFEYTLNVRPLGFTKGSVFSIDEEKYTDGNLTSTNHEVSNFFVGTSKVIKHEKYGDNLTYPYEVDFIYLDKKGDKENTYNEVLVVDMVNRTYKLEDNYEYVIPNKRIEDIMAKSFNTYNSNDFYKPVLENYTIESNQTEEGNSFFVSNKKGNTITKNCATFILNPNNCTAEYIEVEKNSYTKTSISVNLNDKITQQHVQEFNLDDYEKIED